MRGTYTVSFTTTTFTNANGDYDFFEIDPAANEPIEIVAIFIGNKTEVGDTQEEEVAWSIRRFSGATFTSGNGSATTPVALVPGDEAASFAAETVASTVATSTGTTVVLHYDTFNIRAGLQLIFPPDMRPKCDGATDSALVVRLDTALADDADLRGTLYVRQLM